MKKITIFLIVDNMKGIILAGGSGTRLYPITHVISKQLLPIYDKPMIYYPLSVLMLAGIREILIISTTVDIERYKLLLGDGTNLGLNFSYVIQEKPNGLAEAFILGQDFIRNDTVSLILGDNIFYGQHFSEMLLNAAKIKSGALIFGYYVKNPSGFGVVQFDSNNNVISLEEKPMNPKSHYIIPGLYFYDNKVVEYAKNLSPSERGELEITDLNRIYLRNKNLKVQVFGRGMAWFDTGSHDSLLEASNFVEAIQKRQGLYIACIEEIAFRLRYINRDQLLKLAELYLKTDYGKYLVSIANEDI
jgi:glucose-1-phosphate thymidylyltransferase